MIVIGGLIAAPIAIDIAGPAIASCTANPVLCANNVGTWLIETVGFEGYPAAGLGMTADSLVNSLSKTELNELAAIMELYKNNRIENSSVVLNEIKTTLSENGAYKIVYDRTNNTIIKQIKVGNGMDGNSVANELTGITQKQLDKKFKHAADFGLTTTKKNAETLSQYETAIKSHIGDEATKPLGTYGFVTDSKVFFNSNTNNVVVLDKSGNFVTGFKITPGTPQYENYMKNGVLR